MTAPTEAIARLSALATEPVGDYAILNERHSASATFGDLRSALARIETLEGALRHAFPIVEDHEPGRCDSEAVDKPLPQCDDCTAYGLCVQRIANEVRRALNGASE